ncbi:MAG: hypothetical protein QGH33_20035, partial [Pirellulaceae bacterium]|nr:hypothetical protein [Pirellulaceae bacterium]
TGGSTWLNAIGGRAGRFEEEVLLMHQSCADSTPRRVPTPARILSSLVILATTRPIPVVPSGQLRGDGYGD